MPENISLWQSVSHNVWALLTIIVLVICSAISWWVIVERYWRFKQAKIDANQLIMKLRKILKKTGKFDKANIPEAATLCRETNGPVAAVLKEGLQKYGNSKNEIEDNMKKVAVVELGRLEKNLVIIGSIGSVAPFIGLLGTVIGVTEAFLRLASIGGGGIATVGSGIAVALIATIIGLFVAIPAVVAYNYFTAKVNEFSVEISSSSVELMNLIGGKDLDREKWDAILKEIKE